MQTFVSTVDFTEKGIANIGDTTKRANGLRSLAEKMGARVKEIFWTLGAHDGLVIFEAPDEETAAALMLKQSSNGAIRTQTSRAYREDEISEILSKLSD